MGRLVSPPPEQCPRLQLCTVPCPNTFPQPRRAAAEESPGCAAPSSWKVILLGRVTGTGNAKPLLGCRTPLLSPGLSHLVSLLYHLLPFSAGWELRGGEVVGGRESPGRREVAKGSWEELWSLKGGGTWWQVTRMTHLT